MREIEIVRANDEWNPQMWWSLGKESVLLLEMDVIDFLKTIPPSSASLIVTSPPYNIGKEYERGKTTPLERYVEWQREVVSTAVTCLKPDGHICWQVGNYVRGKEVAPLDCELYPIFKDLGLRFRNRIIWHFGHGLHSTRRFSGRHETILWFTKGDNYFFDVDPVRVPQKYPNKRQYKGPRKGQLSGNPLGKSPGDVWSIPNVKSNHCEKTDHPCQFPVELVERLVLTMTQPGDLVVDPFVGVGSSLIAAFRHGRRAAGCDLEPRYLDIVEDRLRQEAAGTLKTRPMGKPIHDPRKG